MNVQALLDAVPLMLKGMGGVFFVIALIYIVIALLLRLPQKKEGAGKA